MNEINKTYPTFGIVVINPEKFKENNLAAYKQEDGYLNIQHHPADIIEMSVDKEELLNKVKLCADHYVVPITDYFKCITNPIIHAHSGCYGLDRNVAEYINLNLSNIFRNEIQTPNLSFISSKDFENIYAISTWFWFMQTKDVGILGIRADALFRTLMLEHFHIDASGVMISTPGGACSDDAQAFITYVAETIKKQLEHYRFILNNPPAPKFDANLYHPRRNINIALDFDGTVTSDYYGFTAMAEMLRERGHKVYLVTMRYRSECVRDKTFMDLVEKVDGYIHTDRQSKKPYCEANGIKIHVWIDDNPEAVNKSAVQIWGTASPEGSIVIEEHGSENHN